MNETSRYFFGLKLHTTWPKSLPEGRILLEEDRHVTLAFIGMHTKERIDALIQKLQNPPLYPAPAGIFNTCLFLPPTLHPRCACWQIDWLTGKSHMHSYQEVLCQKLHEWGYMQEESRPHLPHVTLARSPFDPRLWKRAFKPLPVIATSIALFESIGDLRYHPLWQANLIKPIVEIEHTADTAFLIRGVTVQELYINACIALAFTFPPFIGYFNMSQEVESLEEAISELNSLIAHTDSEIGCPIKAVSFHGKMKKMSAGFLEWEMIIDV